MNKRILVNALSSIGQTFITGLTYFFLYKILINNLGTEKLGLWSLIVAATSMASMGSSGFTNSIVKFIAIATVRKEKKYVNEVVHISVIFTFLITSLFVLILYFVIRFLLLSFIPLQFHTLVIAILPLVLVSFLINSMALIFASILDGLELIYLRNILFSAGSVFFLASAFLLIPVYNFEGLIYAQIIQGVILLISCVGFVLYYLKEITFRKIYFSKATFSQILHYGMNFQLISIVLLLFDPISKFCLVTFGNLSAVGFYEMANRLIIFARSFVVSAIQVIVPNVAKKEEMGTNDTSSYYLKAFKPTLLTAICFLALSVIYAPFISLIWIGKEEPFFILSIIILSVGWAFNILASPSYFINLGLGSLKGNVISHLILGILNLILSITLGYFFNSTAIVCGIALSLVISSLVLMVKFHSDNNIRLSSLTKHFYYRLLTIVCSFIACLILYYSFASTLGIKMSFAALTVLLILISVLLSIRWKLFSLLFLRLASLKKQ